MIPGRFANRLAALAAALVGLLQIGSSSAQTPVTRRLDADALVACTAIARDAERLRCFDAVMLAGGTADSAPESAPSIGATAPSAGVPTSANPANATPPPKSTAARDRFGLNAAPDGPDRIEVVVVEVTKTLSGTARFTTADGQIWLQTSTRSRRYPGLPFEAVIETGSLESYFLEPAGGGAAVRVKRVQ